MGYTTEFKGELKFVTEPTASQLALIKSFLNEDVREHPEWERPAGDAYMSYVDIALADDFSGLKWSGAEKTCGMESLINLILINVRKGWPAFALSGCMTAQGEEFDDRWELVIVDGMAVKRDLPKPGDEITCPHCARKFYKGDI